MIFEKFSPSVIFFAFVELDYRGKDYLLLTY